MEQIKILFFVVGTFFTIEQSRIVAEHTTVTVNPESKTITIFQENLVAFIKTKSDSLQIQTELQHIAQPNKVWSAALENFTQKEKQLFSSEDRKTLNSKLTLTYSDVKDLKAFGIDLNKDGLFSFINLPKSHITSKDGKLGELYWNFKTDKPFTFTQAPLTDLPENYKEFKTSLLPFWEVITD